MMDVAIWSRALIRRSVRRGNGKRPSSCCASRSGYNSKHERVQIPSQSRDLLESLDSSDWLKYTRGIKVVKGGIIRVYWDGSLGCGVHPCCYWHRRTRKMKWYYTRGIMCRQTSVIETVTRVYEGLRGFTRVYEGSTEGLRGFTRVYEGSTEGLRGFTRVRLRVYEGLRGFTRVWLDRPGRAPPAADGPRPGSQTERRVGAAAKPHRHPLPRRAP
eukprot:613926-Pyramimonas_sp.AAC.2